MSGVDQVIVGILIVVGGGLLLAGGKWLLSYTTTAVASAIVKSINGQLGLDEIRADIAGLRDDVKLAATDRRNLQQQLERILTEGAS